MGLAAPQVGVNQRLMVYNPEGVPGRGVEVVLCNPVLEESSEKEDLFEEGCLSFPEIYADVRVRAHSGSHATTHSATGPRMNTTTQIYANPMARLGRAGAERHNVRAAPGYASASAPLASPHASRSGPWASRCPTRT